MEPGIDKKKFSLKLKWLPVGIVILLLLAAVLYGVSLLHRKTIYSNVYIESVPVGDLSAEEADSRVRQVLEEELRSRRVIFYFKEARWEYSYASLGYQYDYRQAAEAAYAYGREGSLFTRIQALAQLAGTPYRIDLFAYFDTDRLEAILNELGEGVRQESANAVLERVNGRFVITQEKPGIELDREALKRRLKTALLQQSQAPLELPVAYSVPRITEQVLQDLEGPIGTFTTTFNAEVTGRSANIALASKSINGLLLMPGEIFSFNTQTGSRGEEEGYQEAPIIVNGKLVPGIGGGICQVSTTLYNAVVRADLEIVERRNHSLPVSYVPLGHDATVAYGYIDFQFMNDHQTPIYLESQVQGNQVTVTIYGKLRPGRTIKLESQVVETIQPGQKIKEDPNLFEDQLLVESEAKTGYRVHTYKVYLENGVEVNRELITKDYYVPVEGISVRGTKVRAADLETDGPAEATTESEEAETPEESSGR